MNDARLDYFKRREKNYRDSTVFGNDPTVSQSVSKSELIRHAEESYTDQLRSLARIQKHGNQQADQLHNQYPVTEEQPIVSETKEM